MSSGVRPHGKSGAHANRGFGSNHTIECTRSGFEAASIAFGDPDSNTPARIGRCAPTASITASVSDTRVSRFGSATLRLDNPIPRRSCRITRANEVTSRVHAALNGSSSSTSMLPGQSDCQTTSTGPSPST